MKLRLVLLLAALALALSACGHILVEDEPVRVRDAAALTSAISLPCNT